jgi:hypothetical protein
MYRKIASKKAIKADKVRRALIKEGIEADDKEDEPIQRAKRQHVNCFDF